MQVCRPNALWQFQRARTALSIAQLLLKGLPEDWIAFGLEICRTGASVDAMR